MRRLYNLKKFLNIYLTEDTELINTYIESDSLPLKENEIEDLKSLINLLELGYKDFEGFFLGYIVPHIGHEMDLLKVTDNAILNIELKSQSEITKINKQQKYNYFYLKTLNKKVSIITYNKYEEKFYKYCSESEESIEINIDEVREELIEYGEEKFKSDIDYLFKPSNFLISPFNDTNKFLEGKYYLTAKQEEIKKDIINHNGTIAIIEGRPGTGKSLLLYDIARTLKHDFNILMIHCALLNEGHELMIEENWDIKSAHKNWVYNEENYEGKNYIFIDESHRFYPAQLKYVLETAIKKDIKIITTIDPSQYLRDNENDFNNLEQLKNYSDTYYKKIGNKIRSNPEIASFVKSIINLKNKPEYKYENISVEYLSKEDDWMSYLQNLQKKGWTYLPFTKSKDSISYHKYCYANRYLNTHRIIGQEFNKVAVILDEGFKYEDGYLGFYGAYYYNPRQMLFQNLTRAREKIKVIVINNIELYKKISKVLIKSSDKNEISFNFFVPKLDNDKLKTFYGNILDFKVNDNQKITPGKRKICFQLGEIKLSFYENEDIPKYNECAIEIVVSNLNELKKRILDENIDLISDEKDKKIKYITLKDPLKNKLRLIEYI
ncbi:AAA family ATPase [Staphylococcus chromogenes]|uniref:AAA family ATPase n=1 Tax=Staphylococcus chromogenes TaxID=46126 RepID=UPI002888C817|nr:AAA family ATPase [Staphylococcus chromogenes]MDT0740503.1 AAA family ATPase [Staphylococcus chromogenes]